MRHRLPDLWLHVPIDSFFKMVDLSHPTLGPKPMTALGSRGFFSGMVAAWKALMDHGNRLLIDVVANRPLLDDCARLLPPHRVMIVRLTGSPDVLASRERGRGDRPLGMAHEQSNHLDRNLADAQDLLIDTSQRSVDEIADLLIQALTDPPKELLLQQWKRD